MDQESTADGQTPDASSTDQGQAPAPPAPDAPAPGTGKTFDEAYVKQLRAEAAANRKAAQEAAAKIEEFENRDKSEVEKLSSKLAKAEARATAAEASFLRFQVAAEKQIPADAVDLLTGSTREELEANADKLLALTKSGAPAPNFDGGAREPAPEPDKPEDAHSKLLTTLFGQPPST